MTTIAMKFVLFSLSAYAGLDATDKDTNKIIMRSMKAKEILGVFDSVFFVETRIEKSLDLELSILTYCEEPQYIV